MPGMNPNGPMIKVPNDSASDAIASPHVLGVRLGRTDDGRDAGADAVVERGIAGGGGIGALAGRGTTTDC